jgi:uncharacterized protein (TIGR02145 family)
MNKVKLILIMASLSLSMISNISCSSGDGGNKIPDERNCNGKEYEPQTHFCFENAIYEKCGQFAYNPKTNKCDPNDFTLLNLCGTEWYKPDISKYCFNGNLRDKETFTDKRNGTVYKSVVIGTQTWMAENLKVNLPYFSKCYDDLESNCDIYGRLYNWTAAGSVCPDGWHLPEAEEWLTLINYVEDGDEGSNGRKLRTTSGWEWSDPYYYKYKGNPNGTDDFGFSALPGGMCFSRNGSEKFDDIGYRTFWWIDTRREFQIAYMVDLGGGNIYKEDGKLGGDITSDYLSIRCVKD